MKIRKAVIWFLALAVLVTCYPMQTRAERRNYIMIDTERQYEGMKNSFSEGYEPVIQENSMNLVVPFKTLQEIGSAKITVGVSFEKNDDNPFYYKNYQKQVEKSSNGIYLYQNQILLKEKRINGQYPLKLTVQAQTAEGIIQQEFIIYVEITDGEAKVAANKDSFNENNTNQEEIVEQSQQVEHLPEPNLEENNTLNQKGNEGETEKVHQPRVIIDSNSFQESSLQAGSSTLWNITAKNSTSGQSMENIKVTLLCESQDIVFEKTSWYFAKAGSSGKMDLSQTIFAAKKAPAELVPIQFQFEYEDNQGNSYTSTEKVNISINQPQQAQLVNISFPESIYESDTNALTFQVQNTGLSVIYNAKVRLEGKGLFPTKEMFLGNIEAGAASDGEIKVFTGTLNMDENGEITEETEKYGQTSGTIIFSFENENGEVIEQKNSINTEIKKPQTVKLKVEKEEPKTNQWWITIIIGIIGVLLLAVISFYIRMQHFKKRVEFHEKS